jgi:hypothetical protein
MVLKQDRLRTGSFGDANAWRRTLRGWIGDEFVKSNLRASSGRFAMLQ